MAKDINLELNAGEALVLHGILTEKSTLAHTTWRRMVTTNAPADEELVVRSMVALYERLLARIEVRLWPRCEWQTGCDGVAVEGSHYCVTHSRLAVVA